MGMLLFREQIVSGYSAVPGENWVWDCCCIRCKLCVGVLLYTEQIICGGAAVPGTNCLFECCCTVLCLVFISPCERI